MPSFFFDSVVLSNFALTKNTDLLTDRYGKRAVLTSEVLDEIAHGVACGYESLREVITKVSRDLFSTTSLRQEELARYTTLLRTLGTGEASCIVCAESRGGIVVTDDRAARSACQDANVQFTGTVGILMALSTEKKLSPSRADAILNAMIEQGFYSPVNSISSLL